MPRLIDADALLKNNAYFVTDCDKYLVCVVNEAEIRKAPTIDAVPVVRCKDCKWYAPNNDNCWIGCTFDVRHPDDVPKESDFCSYGERRSDD